MADTNINPIRTVQIHFKQHLELKYNKANTHLNSYFAHSLPRLDAIYTDATQTTFNAQFVDIIYTQSIKVIANDISAATGAPPDTVHLAVKERLDGSILMWHHGMDNAAPIRKISNIQYAFSTAMNKKATCVHLYINIDHLMFAHEFIGVVRS